MPRHPGDIDRLIAAHPFALVVSSAEGTPVATPLPLLLERDADGTLALLGHIARAHPHAALLRRTPRALVVFQGPHGYISPSWLTDRTRAPTWNYETVHFEVDVEFDERAEATDDALARLVDHMERHRPGPWSAAEMGARYAALAQAVVAFRARVVAAHPRFKLGQDERPDIHADILAALARTDQQPLREAMMRAQRGSD